MPDIHIPIIAEEAVKLAEPCPDCGGFDGTLLVDEARVRALVCTDCHRELEVVDTDELDTGAIRNVGIIAHPGASQGLDLPMDVEVIKIGGMDSFVCCGNCRAYHDGRFPCPRCGHTA